MSAPPSGGPCLQSRLQCIRLARSYATQPVYQPLAEAVPRKQTVVSRARAACSSFLKGPLIHLKFFADGGGTQRIVRVTSIIQRWSAAACSSSGSICARMARWSRSQTASVNKYAAGCPRILHQGVCSQAGRRERSAALGNTAHRRIDDIIAHHRAGEFAWRLTASSVGQA
jgi:hypothetical protein